MHAFVAPKIIGGKNAPSPVGELGMVEMTQALELIDVQYEQVRNISICTCISSSSVKSSSAIQTSMIA